MIKNYLSQALLENNFSFSEKIQLQFIQYLELMQKWNKTFNLTAICDDREMVYLHILDSLSVLPYLQGKRILDVGTGAGLPGVPLSIVSPDKVFVLLDSNSKKTRFLTQVVCTLKLTNVEIVAARSEDYHPQECFDTILSRAFASLKKMLTASEHLVCKDGRFVAMKGLFPEQELKDVPASTEVSEVVKLNIQGINAERHVVVLRKNQ